ncbi:MAG: glycosyltransferase family 2 protein, partial [Moorea sp. SIO2B7]|nr:glycosyltransferase family 2 protein [Moorena sp. SIO2B7]
MNNLNLPSSMLTSFSVLIPYFNEEDFLPQTLRCWLEQTRLPDELILVDNASTDATTQRCKTLLESHPGLSVTFLQEQRPGKVHALKTGLKHIRGTFVVFADADTYYPPHYLALCEQLIGERPKNLMGLMALNSSGVKQTIPQKLKRQCYVELSKVFQRQSYTGNYGQILHTETLRKAGGFSEAQW